MPADRQLRVLVVEDNDDNREMLTRRLRRAGFEVLTAIDGAEAVRAVAAERLDLVLMDLSLPVMDGWEATRRIRAAEGDDHLPIVALTAYAFESDRETALAAGCDEFASKPVDFPDLVERIHRLAGARP